jgi:hypothetical protein
VSPGIDVPVPTLPACTLSSFTFENGNQIVLGLFRTSCHLHSHSVDTKPVPFHPHPLDSLLTADSALGLWPPHCCLDVMVMPLMQNFLFCYLPKHRTFSFTDYSNFTLARTFLTIVFKITALPISLPPISTLLPSQLYHLCPLLPTNLLCILLICLWGSLC